MRELTAPQADDLYELIFERAAEARPLMLTSYRPRPIGTPFPQRSGRYSTG